MTTIQSMSVALDADISGLRQGLQRAENRVEQFRNNVNADLSNIQGDFRVRGRSTGAGWASSAVGAMASGIGSAASAVGNALSGAMKSPVVLGAVIAGAAALGLAAAGAFSIALAGAGLVGISAYIVKDVPKVKKAFGELKKTAKDVFKDAAAPMVEPIETAIDDIKVSLLRLKPDFKELFQSVADSGATKHLTDGLHKMLKGILHGLTDMMNKAKPVFEGLEEFMADVGEGIGGFFREIGKAGPEAKIVLKDLGEMVKGFLIGAGKVLAFFIKLRAKAIGLNQALGKVWDLITGKLDSVWQVLKSTFGKMIKYVKDFPGKVIGALLRFVKNIKQNFVKAKNAAIDAVKWLVRKCVEYFAGMPMKAWRALSSLGSKLRGRALSAGRSLVNAIKNKISDAVSKVRSLPGRAVRALGNIGSRLYNSGRSLISGFVSGIWSKIGDVARAAASVVSRARDFFPFSPAKEGPFSGKGYTTFSGAALVDGFREGIAGGLPGLRNEVDAMYGTVPNMRADVSGVVRAGRRQEPQRLVIDVTGADEGMKNLIRRIVQKDGRGDVQYAFGR